MEIVLLSNVSFRAILGVKMSVVDGALESSEVKYVFSL